MYGPVAKVTILKNPGGSGPPTGTAVASYEDALFKGNTQTQAAWHVTPSPAQSVDAGEEFSLPALRSLTIAEGIGEAPKITLDLVISMMDLELVTRLMASGVLEAGSLVVAQIGYPSSNTWTRLYKGITQIPSVTIGDDGFITVSVPAAGFGILSLKTDVSGQTFPGKSKLAVIKALATSSGIAGGVDTSEVNPDDLLILEVVPPAEQTKDSSVPAPFEVIPQGESAMAAMLRIANTAKCDLIFTDIKGREGIKLSSRETQVEGNSKGSTKTFRFFGFESDAIPAKGFTTESPLFWIPGTAASRVSQDLRADTKESQSEHSGGDGSPSSNRGRRAAVKRREPGQSESRGRPELEGFKTTANSSSPDQIRHQAGDASRMTGIGVGVKSGWSFQGRPVEIFERVKVTGLPLVVTMPGGWVIQSASHQFSAGQWETSVNAYGTGVYGHVPAKTQSSAVAVPAGSGDGKTVEAKPG